MQAVLAHNACTHERQRNTPTPTRSYPSTNPHPHLQPHTQQARARAHALTHTHTLTHVSSASPLQGPHTTRAHHHQVHRPLIGEHNNGLRNT
jgi:hypothetical protein